MDEVLLTFDTNSGNLQDWIAMVVTSCKVKNNHILYFFASNGAGKKQQYLQ
jgi:hypothetical protein